MKAKTLLLLFAGITASAFLLAESISTNNPLLPLSQLPNIRNDTKISTPPKEQETKDPDRAKKPSQDEEPAEQSPLKPPKAQTNPNPNPEAPTQQKSWWVYPEEILPVQGDPNDLDVVVNKKYQLSAQYIPADLVPLSDYNLAGLRVVGNFYLREIVIEPLQRLGKAAETDGIDLSVVSAYRSYQTQQSTYNYWLQYNGGNQSLADQVSARAGHSEHQLGTTVDFSTNEAGDRVGEQFNTTAAAKWLANNAEKFGFELSYPKGKEEETGYAYEAWHYRYRSL